MEIENLTDLNETEIIVSPSQINAKIASLIKGEKSLSDVRVKGEISNFVDHVKTGHLYFTLKDEASSIKAVMFSRNAKALKFKPENGATVTVRANVQIYEKDGQCQLYVTEMKPDGLGELYAAFLELREKLEKEGLFSQKRPIPRSPKKIIVITAETGAALQDILNIIGRRNPLVSVALIPALVQGANAPASLISAFKTAQSISADAIIFGRGGGSIEDLWAFNNEDLARTIFNSAIPTISAVGHEVDFTIADFVADLRAPTPSAAAELCVLDIGETYNALNALKNELYLSFQRRASLSLERLDALQREINARSPSAKLEVYQKNLTDFEARLKAQVNGALTYKKQLLISEMKRVDALSPLNVLARGYSIITDERNKAVTEASSVDIGDVLNIRLHKGKITAKVEGRNG